MNSVLKYCANFLLVVVLALGTCSAFGQDLDFDGNGQCDEHDLDLLCAQVGQTCQSPNPLDLNGDGCITVGSKIFFPNSTMFILNLDGDVGIFLYFCALQNNQGPLPYFPGDSNLDGAVDGIDFIAWNMNKFQPGTWSQGDFNCDGVVDGIDFIIWKDNSGF